MIEHAYIHIPFCLRKCKYCSFVSGFSISAKNDYLFALKNEISKRYKGDLLKTLYFGGGTPSLLESMDIEELLNMFNLDTEAEITLEANPETVTEEKFLQYRKAGINRISLGVQSFKDELLALIGRNHSKQNIYSALENIKSAGFKNISIDLIYGLPSQTIKMFYEDLQEAVKLGTTHISTYGLKIENDSFFGKNPPKNLPDDEIQAKMYKMLCEFLKENKFLHYEISNFAKKGFYSRHNCAYWQNKNYYGFGLNASGYENMTRYRNIENFKMYIKNPLLKEEENVLTFEEKLEEEIFLALRLTDGVNIAQINEKFGIDFCKKYSKILEKYSKNGLLKYDENRCYLTEEGFLLSNNIMAEFIE